MDWLRMWLERLRIRREWNREFRKLGRERVRHIVDRCDVTGETFDEARDRLFIWTGEKFIEHTNAGVV